MEPRTGTMEPRTGMETDRTPQKGRKERQMAVGSPRLTQGSAEVEIGDLPAGMCGSLRLPPPLAGTRCGGVG